MVNETEARKIMTKPLPQILDEIEDSIRLADEAAKNAREAAVQVRKAGDKAVSETSRIANERIDTVERVMNERIDMVEQMANNAMQLAELLKLALTEGVVALDKRLSEKTSATGSTAKKSK